MAETDSDVTELEAIYDQLKKAKTVVPQTQTKDLLPTKYEKSEKEEIPAPMQKAEEQVTSSLPLEKPISEQTEHPSFNGTIMKVLDRKMKQVDDEAAIKKKNIEDTFYSKLFTFMDSVASDSPVLTPKVNQPQTSQPQVIVKDNSEAIRLITVQLLDPKVKNKEPLLYLKRQLQGQPYEEAHISPINSKQSNHEPEIKPALAKKGTSLKTALLALGLFLVGGIAVIYLISKLVGGG